MTGGDVGEVVFCQHGTPYGVVHHRVGEVCGGGGGIISDVSRGASRLDGGTQVGVGMIGGVVGDVGRVASRQVGVVGDVVHHHVGDVHEVGAGRWVEQGGGTW